MAKDADRHWWTDGKYVISLGEHRSGERLRWRVRGYAVGQHGEARWRYEVTHQGAAALANSLKEAWLKGLADVERPLPPPRTIVDLGSAWMERDAYNEKTGKPWSPSTKALRVGILANLYKICGLARSPRTVTAQDIYRACEAESSSRQYGSWCALRRLFNWAMERGFCQKNPADTKRAKRFYRAGPQLESITYGQLGAILKACEGREAHDVILLMSLTGMRVGEFAQWRHGWITKTAAGYWIDVPEHQDTENGGSWGPKTTHGARCIPLLPEAWEAYLVVCQRWGVNPYNPPKDWVVFPGSERHRHHIHVMTRVRSKGAYYKLVSEWSKKAGIPQRVHPHTLRHLYGSMALDRNTPMSVISSCMGHSSVEVTEGIYARHTKRSLCAAMFNHLSGVAAEWSQPEPLAFPTPAQDARATTSLDELPWENAPVPAECLPGASSPSGVPGHKGAAAPSSSPADLEHGADHGTPLPSAPNQGPGGVVFRPVFQGDDLTQEALGIRRVANQLSLTAKLSPFPESIEERPPAPVIQSAPKIEQRQQEVTAESGTRDGTRDERGAA